MVTCARSFAKCPVGLIYHIRAAFFQDEPHVPEHRVCVDQISLTAEEDLRRISKVMQLIKKSQSRFEPRLMTSNLLHSTIFLGLVAKANQII